MESAMHRKPIIFDTDPGDDDAVSLIWALASGAFDIKAITVTNGNISVDKCLINALRVLELCNRTDIPVFGGAYRPLVRPSINAEWIHGSDGLGDQGFALPTTKPQTEFAPQAMVRIAKESLEPITILSIGPLTNVALAILSDPEFEHRVKEVVFMGGAVKVSGNQAPRASYNVMVDPEAAKVVYNSAIPVVQIGLDVCDLVTQTVQDLDCIEAQHTKVSEFIIKLLSFRRDKAVQVIQDEQGNVVGGIKASEQVAGRGQGIGLNDLTATGYLINPDWFSKKFVTIDVETNGMCAGETIVDYMGLWGRNPNNYFVYDVTGKELVSQWVKDMQHYTP